MKRTRFLIATFLCVLTLCSCVENNDPDPRLDFEGIYTLEPFQFRVEKPVEPDIKPVLAIATRPSIIFKRGEWPTG